jgi:hypothetical protein
VDGVGQPDGGRRLRAARVGQPVPGGLVELDELYLVGDLDDAGPWFSGRQALTAPTADPGWNGLDTLFSASRTPGQAAILQPPKPTIAPSRRILEHAAEHDIEPGAEG